MDPQSVLIGCIVIFGLCLITSFVAIFFVRMVISYHDKIHDTLSHYSATEGQARQRHYFLQAVDNMQVWKLGGKTLSLAAKIPYEVLGEPEIDLAKYYTDEELAGFRVGIEAYGADDRLSSIAKVFKY